MKKKFVKIGSVLAAVVVSTVAFAVPSFAHSNNANVNFDDHDWSDWHNNKSKMITLKQTNLQPPTAPTAVGQNYVMTDDAFDQNNNKIGHDDVVCTATMVDPTNGTEMLCDGTLSLDNKGDVQVQGLYTLGDTDFKVSVVGGDGIFRFGRGQASVHVNMDGTRTIKFDFN